MVGPAFSHVTAAAEVTRGLRILDAAPPAPCSRSSDASILKQECNDLPPKPKGMHWRTYNRLVDRYDRYDQQWSWEAMRRFGRWL